MSRSKMPLFQNDALRVELVIEADGEQGINLSVRILLAPTFQNGGILILDQQPPPAAAELYQEMTSSEFADLLNHLCQTSTVWDRNRGCYWLDVGTGNALNWISMPITANAYFLVDGTWKCLQVSNLVIIPQEEWDGLALPDWLPQQIAEIEAEQSRLRQEWWEANRHWLEDKGNEELEEE